MDTADTKTIDGGDLYVSFISPVSSPGVSNEVVVLSRLVSVSDSGDGVVEGGSAELRVHNTGLVHLEDGFVGLNGDGNWLLSDGSLQLGDGIGWDGGVGLYTNLSIVLTSLASLVDGFVGVVRFKILSILLGVNKGASLRSTVASMRIGNAINELLLRKGKEFSGGDKVGTLDGSGGGESPA